MAEGKDPKVTFTAEDGVSSVVKKIIDSLGSNGLAQAATAVSTSFLAVKEAVNIAEKAFSAVEHQIDLAVEAASEMDKTNRKLALSMANTGEYTKESFEEIYQWGETLEKATGQSKTAALDLITLGTNMGLTVEQSKLAAQAAIDLGAATGNSADAAMRQLAVTMTGTAGRMAKMVPEVATLTEAQLRQGKAIELVAGKYKDFAKDSAGTYEGAQARVKAATENIYEGFGRLIVQNPLYLASLQRKADMLNAVAERVDALATFLLNNIDTVAKWAKALVIAAVAVGVVVLAMNAATVATVAMTVATIAMKAVMAATPWGLAIAGVMALAAGIVFLMDNWQKITGVVQQYVGMALGKLISVMEVVLTGHMMLVRIFSKDLADAMKNTLASWKAQAAAMEESGKKASESADAANKAGDAHKNAGDIAERAVDGLAARIEASAQAAKRASAEYAKAFTDAKDVFGKIGGFVPRIGLEKFKEDSAAWEVNLKTLQDKAKKLQLVVNSKVGGATADDREMLEAVKKQEMLAGLALKAIKIKTRQEIRDAELKEVDIMLNDEKNKTILVTDEIMQKRIAAGEQLYGQLVAIATNRMLAERGIEEMGATDLAQIKLDALQAANKQEIDLMKEGLQQQLDLAVTMEDQKQAAINAVKMNVTKGLETSVNGDLSAERDIALETSRQAQLKVLRDQEFLTEQQYQTAVTDSRIAEITARTTAELAQNKEREDQLGLSEAGMEARLERTRIEAEQLNQINVLKHQNAQITDAEFQTMQLEGEKSHLAAMAEAKLKFLGEEAARNEVLGDKWGATLAKMRAEQVRHGQILGAIRGVQQSEEFQGLQGALGNLSSLRSSKNKEAFEIGKKAAIAQAMINTFMSATAAYASLAAVPIVGPALGAAAAAAAVIAGLANISNIAAQKFEPGGQADQGLDSVPASMSGKSFILSGGEAVLQPEANKDLRQAAKSINEGGGGSVNNFYFNIYGDVGASQMSQLRDTMIDVLRSESEKGTPIINEKGIVRAS